MTDHDIRRSHLSEALTLVNGESVRVPIVSARSDEMIPEGYIHTMNRQIVRIGKCMRFCKGSWSGYEYEIVESFDMSAADEAAKAASLAAAERLMKKNDQFDAWLAAHDSDESC